MTQDDTSGEAVSLLQELGLQEYEARSLLALTQLSSGTAKEIHEISEVPRTRVYDAIRELESQGLVQVQHSSPQRYRAVPIDEAVRTLRRKYVDRIETLETHLERIERREAEPREGRVQEVWSLAGTEAIDSRTFDLLDGAESELVLVVDESLLSEVLLERLDDAVARGVTIFLGGETGAITDRMDSLSTVRIFEAGLDWLTGARTDHEAVVSRLVLADRDTLLVGSSTPGDPTGEQAVVATGFENSVVVLLRWLLSSELASTTDPDG